MDAKHSTWLNLITRPPNGDKVVLEEVDRLSYLSSTIQDSALQTPSLITFVGGAAKNRALRNLLKRNSQKWSSCALAHRSDVQLHLVPLTAASPFPLLVADCAPPRRLRAERPGFGAGQLCQEVFQRPLQWDSSLSYAAEALLPRVLGPFTDVLCLFASDLGGLVGAVSHLIRWINTGENACYPHHRPCVVIVIERAGKSIPPHWDLINLQLVVEMLLSARLKADIDDCFADIKVLSVAHRYDRIQRHIKTLLESARIARSRNKMLFAWTHFGAFLRAACLNFSENVDQQFNFILATRKRAPVSENIAGNAASLLTWLTPGVERREAGVPLVASALVLDSLPPDMHAFQPRAVFRVLYKDLCRTALKSVNSDHLLPLIEQRFCVLTDDIGTQGVSAREAHVGILRNHRSALVPMQSILTCYVCLTNIPERGLPCGHYLCEGCVRSFGKMLNGQRHVFTMPECPLCGTGMSNFTAPMKPPTAGIRFLSIDGGGVRGVLPLKALRSLEETFSRLTGARIPIQENFDLALGTSSGGLIVLGLFINGWSAKHCLQRFVQLARRAFTPVTAGRIPGLGFVMGFILSLLTDSRYGAQNLEDSLIETFGGDRKMLDWVPAHSYGTKVAVTATTTGNSSPCLFSNYNGEGSRPSDCGYQLVKGVNTAGVRVWEAARCTTAAPSYFPPKRLVSDGGTRQVFQDGGLRHNNPVKLGRWEARVLWPQSTDDFDLVLSMGTGRGSESASNDGDLGWRGCYLARLFRSFMTSIDGQKTWEEFYNELSAVRRASSFRINARFDGTEPNIDDLNKMEEMYKSRYPGGLEKRELELQISKVLVAKQFYFELDRVPRYSNGRYSCGGHLRCRLFEMEQFAMLRYLSKISASFCIGDRPITATISTPFSVKDGCFEQHIEFFVGDLEEHLAISLVGFSMEDTTISGFPTTISALLRAQGYDNVFGSGKRAHDNLGAGLRDYERPRKPPKRPRTCCS